MLKEGNSHGNIVQVFFMTLTGALFGYTYVRSGKIAYSIVLHMLCNISSLLNILTGSTDGRPVAE
ncbi:CPBP family glutamic-type intramembrane protease [Eubacteriales bacterium SGI.150]